MLGRGVGGDVHEGGAVDLAVAVRLGLDGAVEDAQPGCAGGVHEVDVEGGVVLEGAERVRVRAGGLVAEVVVDGAQLLETGVASGLKLIGRQVRTANHVGKQHERGGQLSRGQQHDAPVEAARDGIHAGHILRHGEGGGVVGRDAASGQLLGRMLQLGN